MRKAFIFYASAFMVALSGCASIGAPQTESMLSAAQFTMKRADTRAKLANLKALTQNKIMVHTKNGKNYYVYADAAQCQCVYVGTAANYQHYQQIRIAQNIADDQVAAAEMNQAAMMDFGAWGPLGGSWGGGPGFID